MTNRFPRVALLAPDGVRIGDACTRLREVRT
jgi:hypothetical protein